MAIVDIGPAHITHPALLSLMTRLGNAAILSVAKAVAHHADPTAYPIGAPDALEAHFQTFFEQFPAERQQAAVAKMMALISADPTTRTATFGDLAIVDLHSPDAIFAQLAAIPVPAEFAQLHIGDIVTSFQTQQPEPAPVLAPGPFAAAGLSQQAAANVLTLSVDQIHCDRVTGLFGIAPDDIYFGGVTIDSVGNVQEITPFEVGSFGNGDTKSVANPFASFPIESQMNWPKAYAVTMVLAERHLGGVYDYVYALAKQAAQYIVTALTTAVGGLIGGIVGSTFPVLGTIVGAVVGAVIGWLVGLVWGWLKANLFGDDIFVPATMSTSIGSAGGLPGTPAGSWDLRGFDGEYHINASWHLSWGAPNVNACWHKYFDGKWSAWEPLGGTLNFGVALASWGPHRVDVVARGLDDALWHTAWDGSARVAWESLGGALISSPAIASWGTGRLDVFAIGTDQAMYHKAFGGTWSAWQSLGGKLTSAPAAVSWGPNRIDVVARGLDNAVWTIAWDGKAWSAWESLGGEVNYGLGLSSWASGRLDVFGTGADLALWHKWFDGGKWSTGWESLGGGLASAPAAVSWSPNRMDIVARGE